jgi:hypothetical protein
MSQLLSTLPSCPHRLWMQKQEVAFTAWLNRVLMPVHATAIAREAVGMSTSTEVCDRRLMHDI